MYVFPLLSKIEMVIVTFLAVFNIISIMTGAAFRQTIPEIVLHLVATVILVLWAFRSLRGWTRSSTAYNTEYRMLRSQLEKARKKEDPSGAEGYIAYKNEEHDVPALIVCWQKFLWWTGYTVLVIGEDTDSGVAELTEYNLPVEKGYVKRTYTAARWEVGPEGTAHALLGEPVEPAGIIGELTSRRLWEKENPELYAASREDLSQLRGWLART